MQAVSAPVDTPRGRWASFSGTRSVSVRLGYVMAAGEGIETMLSLRCVMPQYGDGSRTFGSTSRSLPVSATLRQLYIVRDDDRAGDGAVPGLFDRAQSARIEAMVLSPQCEDFNEDLRNFDISALRAALRIQLTLEDVGRFLITGI
jgi:hypothetical protein